MRRLPQTSGTLTARLLRVALIVIATSGAGVLLAVVVGVAVGGLGGTGAGLRPLRELAPAEGFSSSPLARWWRCRGSHRPSLARPGRGDGASGWRLEYSWTGGYGNGDVHLSLESGGSGRLTVREHGRSEAEVVEADVPPAALRSIARAVDESSFLCLEPLPRSGHRVMDLGRYSVTIIAAGYTKTVYVDSCHFVADGEAFAAVLAAVYDLESVLGERVAWGPRGIATIDRPCSDAELGVAPKS